MSYRIGVIGTSDIARRRMIPAIKKSRNFEYVGVAIASSSEWDEPHSELEYVSIFERKKIKAQEFENLFGGKIYEGYEIMLQDRNIDAVYIPLPPALHYKWAKKALEYGKHILLEKPFTVSFSDTEDLIQIASKNNLALIENYGFIYHKQFEKIKELFNNGQIGELRLIRGTFGFPHREASDFRYSKKYGGGAFLDCGGYTIKAASQFMTNPQVVFSSLKITEGHEVDVYGSVILKDDNDIVAQLSFGMDNSYKCDFELWGSIGSVISNRVFTAPDSFDTVVKIATKDGVKEISCGKDDQFFNIIECFYNAITDEQKRQIEYNNIQMQEKLVKDVFLANKGNK